MIDKIKERFYRWINSDPVKNCPVFKEEGCAFVDGFLCNYPNCEIYRDYLECKLKENEEES